MPPVQGGDFRGAQALCGGDHRSVDGSQRQIAVLGDEFGNALGVCGVQRLDDQFPLGEVTQEPDLGLPAEPGCDQVGDLGDDEGGNDERPGVTLQQLETGGVMSVVSVDVGIERPGVADQRDGESSEARISSIRSETSLRPLRPAPAAPRWRPLPEPRCCSRAARVTSAIVAPRRDASWRSRASSSSDSLMVVRLMGCQHTSVGGSDSAGE